VRPDYVTKADEHGAKIPQLRRFLVEGAWSSGVHGILPTMTFPSHTTLVTGVSPARHGIYSNTPFDPFVRNQEGWNWYFESVRADTLWQAAKRAGLTTANVRWPVTVGAPITYNLPQFSRAGTEEDRKLLRVLSTPGLMAELERAVGPFPESAEDTIERDERFARTAVRLIETKRPGFTAVYLTALDHVEHETGPFSPEAMAVLERIDAAVGELRAAAERAGGGRAIVCVVSDHGFLPADKEVHLKAAFRDAGLITYDAKDTIVSWRATTYMAGTSSAVVLANPADAAVKDQVRALLAKLAADPQGGIASVIEAPRIHELGGNPDAAFWVNLKPGYQLTHDTHPPLVVGVKPGGAHGYFPDTPGMDAAFFIAGPGVARGRALGAIDLRDVAPTLAALFGGKLAGAEGHALTLR
jgi:predicted AlkP superfamily pyrophosphatase or phosphodiesterase